MHTFFVRFYTILFYRFLAKSSSTFAYSRKFNREFPTFITIMGQRSASARTQKIFYNLQKESDRKISRPLSFKNLISFIS